MYITIRMLLDDRVTRDINEAAGQQFVMYEWFVWLIIKQTIVFDIICYVNYVSAAKLRYQVI